QEVYLVGDFNNWTMDENSRMRRQENGWMKTMDLNAGRYRYRFVVDGKWVEDSNNPHKEDNPFGEVDSLLELND
ncbi:MAG: glycoside hydrolase family 13, partial [Candidatus Omnitrophica bacterium]|nr:glycoside hydrolase family 13 [Candidatus Omnitrophota bacterium]